MSDTPQAPDWWQASDGRWYPAEQHPGYQPPPGPATAPQGYPPSGAPATGYGVGPSAPKGEPTAVLSLVAGIGGTLLGLFCCIGVAGSIAAIVLGAIAKQKIARSDGALTGAGIAQAGFIIGIVGTAIVIIANIVLIAAYR